MQNAICLGTPSIHERFHQHWMRYLNQYDLVAQFTAFPKSGKAPFFYLAGHGQVKKVWHRQESTPLSMFRILSIENPTKHPLNANTLISHFADIEALPIIPPIAFGLEAQRQCRIILFWVFYRINYRIFLFVPVKFHESRFWTDSKKLKYHGLGGIGLIGQSYILTGSEFLTDKIIVYKQH